MKMMQIKMQQMAIKMSTPHPCCLGAFLTLAPVGGRGWGGFFDGEILSLLSRFLLLKKAVFLLPAELFEAVSMLSCS